MSATKKSAFWDDAAPEPSDAADFWKDEAPKSPRIHHVFLTADGMIAHVHAPRQNNEQKAFRVFDWRKPAERGTPCPPYIK